MTTITPVSPSGGAARLNAKYPEFHIAPAQVRHWCEEGLIPDAVLEDHSRRWLMIYETLARVRPDGSTDLRQHPRTVAIEYFLTSI